RPGAAGALDGDGPRPRRTHLTPVEQLNAEVVLSRAGAGAGDVDGPVGGADPRAGACDTHPEVVVRPGTATARQQDGARVRRDASQDVDAYAYELPRRRGRLLVGLQRDVATRRGDAGARVHDDVSRRGGRQVRRAEAG